MKEIFKSIIYMARRFKLPTTLNILGLVLAYSTFYLLMTQIAYQSTYNHDVPDSDRLYRLECDYVYPEYGFSDHVCRPFAEALDRIPEVESYSLVNSEDNNFLLKKNEKDTVFFKATNGNNTMVSTIAGKALDGDIEWTDKHQDGAIIPKSFALDYFGTAQATGDSIISLWDDGPYAFPVIGVYEDFPENSDFRNCIYLNLGDRDKSSLNFSMHCYVKFKEKPKDLVACSQLIKQAIIDEINEDTKITNEPDFLSVKKQIQETKVRISPIKKNFFDVSTLSGGNRGNTGMYIFLLLSSIIVIAVGAINYFNCTLVESPMRVKSINTRLVLGANRSRIRKNIIIESIITSVTACLVALALCVLLSLVKTDQLPIMGNIALCNHWKLALAMLAISIVVGFITGWYPAKFATSFQPAIALKASFGLTPQGIKLRNILVFFQLFVSMLMIILIIILFLQNRYFFNSDYGFDKDLILNCQPPNTLSANDVDSLCKDLKSFPEIDDVARSNNMIGVSDDQYMIRTDINGVPINYRFLQISPNYMDVMGIEIIEGRNFQAGDSAVMIVNETARDSIEQLRLGVKISTGFGENNQDSATVIGVCRNFRYGTMRMTQNQPFVLIVDQAPDLSLLSIRMAKDANRNQVEQLVSGIIKMRTKSAPATLLTYNNELYNTYYYEMQYIKQNYTTAFICILLTIFGLLCLTMFESEYRRKEIGIRKVAGATTGEVVKMLSKHYVALILISFAIAAPISYFLGKMTLSYFADSAPIHWWIFPLALLLGGSITLGVVILQSWRTARENPINSIKTE